MNKGKDKCNFNINYYYPVLISLWGHIKDV